MKLKCSKEVWCFNNIEINKEGGAWSVKTDAFQQFSEEFENYLDQC